MMARWGPALCSRWKVKGDPTTKAKRNAVLSQFITLDVVEKKVAVVFARAANDSHWVKWSALVIHSCSVGRKASCSHPSSQRCSAGPAV